MRKERTYDGTPLQQSLTVDPKHSVTFNMTKLMLGVILDVQMSDSRDNRAAQTSDSRRGSVHTATVYVVDDGNSTPAVLKNVIITPDEISALDDYSERIPKGTSFSLYGEQLNSGLNNIDPYSLDGEWCVVGFLGGWYGKPFVLRWWPHMRNTFDPATSGSGNPGFNGDGTALIQSRRKFQRINGVEFVISRQGNIYLSTTYSGTSVLPKPETTRGRLPRSATGSGGSVRLWVKPSEVMELTWNPQEDGLGIYDGHDDALPQTNPANRSVFTQYSRPLARTGTYISYTKDRTYIEVPENFDVLSKKRINQLALEEFNVSVSSGITNTADSTKDITSDLIPGSVIKLTETKARVASTKDLDLEGQVSASVSSLGDTTVSGTISNTITTDGVLKLHGLTALMEALATLALTSPATTITGTTTLNLASASIAMAAPTIAVGSATTTSLTLGGTGGKHLVNEDLGIAWATATAALKTAIDSAVSVGTLAAAFTAIQAILLFVQAIDATLATAKTTKTSAL